MKIKPNETVIGTESLCSGCTFGRVVKTKSVPHPGALAAYATENPHAPTPANFYVQENYCVQRDICGHLGDRNMPARAMGVVVECEMFIPREGWSA